MLRVGLTGGIGSGKSTVARRLVRRGAVLVDSDVLARAVVEPGSEGLAEVVEAFGDRILDGTGSLDRPALAGLVFGDDDARAQLNSIMHPRIRRRSDELIAAAPADAVVIQDVPLLVEGGMATLLPLVVVVHAPVDERMRRLVEQRGVPEADARARIAAQADDEARRAAADVWLDNAGAPDRLDRAVDGLWFARLVPFEENLRRRRPAREILSLVEPSVLVDPDPTWAATGDRLAARIAAAAGVRGRGVAHIGSTAVPGLPAVDVIELQLGVEGRSDADALRDALADAGFPSWSNRTDSASERHHGSADPGRPARLAVREVGSAGWRRALLLRDWLRAEPAAYAAARCAVGAARPVDGPARAEAWAATTGWVPSFRRDGSARNGAPHLHDGVDRTVPERVIGMHRR